MAASVGVKEQEEDRHFKACAHTASVPSSGVEKTSLRPIPSPVPGGLPLTLTQID